MPDIPRHPADDDDLARGPAGQRSRLTWLWWTAGIAALVLFAVLHLTGVLGPGGH